MRYRVCLLAISVLPAACYSQSLLGIGFRAGYSFSGSFTGKTGGSKTLSGPEIGLDIPIGLPLPISSLGGLQFSFSPSYFSGGGEGNVYRILGSARFSLPGSALYGRIAAGFSNASSGNGDFSSQSAYETQLALGIGILNNLPAVKVSAEIAYHQSSLVQVSGWTIGLSARF